MAATTVKLGPTYTEQAANFTLLGFMQILDIGIEPCSAEVVVQANAPAETVVGKQLVAGDFVGSDKLSEIGTSGKLYARKHPLSAAHAPVYLVFE